MFDKIKGPFLCLLGATCWGISGTMGQYLFTIEKMDSKWLVPIRLELAGLILLAYCLVNFRDKLFEPFKKPKDLILVLSYGIFGVTFSQFTYFFTIQYSSAGVGTIMQDLAPVIILFITCIMEKRRPKTKEVAALVLAISGVALIVTHGDFGALLGGAHAASSSAATTAASGGVPPIAIVSGLLCAICVSVYNILTVPLTKKRNYPVLVLQTWAFVLGGIVMGMLFQPWKYDYVPGPMGYVGIVVVVLIGNICAFTFYISGVHIVGPNIGVLYSFAEPVSAAILSTLIFKDPFTGFDLLGFAMIFAMLFLISGVRRPWGGRAIE